MYKKRLIQEIYTLDSTIGFLGAKKGRQITSDNDSTFQEAFNVSLFKRIESLDHPVKSLIPNIDLQRVQTMYWNHLINLNEVRQGVPYAFSEKKLGDGLSDYFKSVRKDSISWFMTQANCSEANATIFESHLLQLAKNGKASYWNYFLRDKVVSDVRDEIRLTCAEYLKTLKINMFLSEGKILAQVEEEMVLHILKCVRISYNIEDVKLVFKTLYPRLIAFA